MNADRDHPPQPAQRRPRQSLLLRARRPAASATLALLFLAPSAAPGQESSYPLLQELNRQTQTLYRDVQGGVVRVQLPTPGWLRDVAAKDDPLRKWGGVIDPAVQKKLEDHQKEAIAGNAGKLKMLITPSTRPSDQPGPQKVPVPTQPPTGWTARPGPNGETILEPRGAESIIIHSGGGMREDGQLDLGGPLRITARPAENAFAPNNIGLLLDDAGHVLVPLYIERETIEASPVRLMVGDVLANASFVGADEKTQLTILKLDKPLGKPVRLGEHKPAEGALVMLLNPNNASGRLMIWTGGQRDYGVTVNMDGTVAGLVRYGQFLGGPAIRPIIDQLIKVGSIQRAIIGARLTEILPDDPLRQRHPALADHPAIVVDQVDRDSIAQKSGLRKGDFILEMGDEPIGDLTTWAALSARGGDVRLLVLRAGTRLELRINLQPPAP